MSPAASAAMTSSLTYLYVIQTEKSRRERAAALLSLPETGRESLGKIPWAFPLPSPAKSV
jgi:hypothetical protein